MVCVLTFFFFFFFTGVVQSRVHVMPVSVILCVCVFYLFVDCLFVFFSERNNLSCLGIWEGFSRL